MHEERPLAIVTLDGETEASAEVGAVSRRRKLIATPVLEGRGGYRALSRSSDTRYFLSPLSPLSAFSPLPPLPPFSSAAGAAASGAFCLTVGSSAAAGTASAAGASTPSTPTPAAAAAAAASSSSAIAAFGICAEATVGFSLPPRESSTPLGIVSSRI